MYLIGIDIGGTNLRAAVISKEGNILEVFKVENEVSKGAPYNLDKLVSQIKKEWNKYEFEKSWSWCTRAFGFKSRKTIKSS